ncbi:type II secretion system protein PulP [Geomonas sp. RF6]|uniref:type II secretion system protein PulP n=1 Tax=Geomonas sp. RF6 TaxID=2897342 RepID=UPI001E479FD6|nr:type II secretion system protein PulP [Geomonas sp. RF6]UFS70870.1 type II secretion system protein PulP [Geomonas sp. RF6]
MNRKKQILAILLVVFAGAIIYSVVRFPKQQRIGSVPPRPAPQPARRPAPAAAPARPAPAGRGERLHLEVLNREGGSTTVRRDLFAPIFRDEVKSAPFKPLPPPPKPLPLPPKSQLPEQPQAQPQQAPPPGPPPPPPMPNFTFLGFLKKGGEQRVFISSEKEIYVVKKGSIIAGNYEVTNLTDDAITIASRSGAGEVVIPLVEHRGLTPRGGRRAP